jgi:PAS domain S-box-containing protein
MTSPGRQVCESLKRMIDFVSDPIFCVDGRGAITFANKAAQEFMNIMPAAEITGLLRQGDGRQGGEAGSSARIELGGKTYAVRRESLGDGGGCLVVGEDISAEIRLQGELHRANERYLEIEEAMKSSYDGIFITDGKGIVLNYNPSYNRITGINASEFLGRHVEEIEKRYNIEAAVKKVLQTRDVVTRITEFIPGLSVLITATPVFAEDGEIFRVIANVRDITELIALNSQLEQARNLTDKYYSEIMHLRSQQAKIEGFIVSSQVMKDVISTALKVGHTNATVTITGESGAGKEVLARTIHNNSEFSNGPFVKINCGAIPETLLESELFGYEKGAFTGASRSGKPGLFEIARGGTVFLDEVGEIPMNLQVKLLGVLQDLQFTRVGGTKLIAMNSRIIAATNRNLADMVAQGNFRKDLYYRLHVVSLKIPSLAERAEDILPLAKHFLDKFNRKYKVHNTLSPQVLNAFVKYDWPGNVREMENLVESLVVLAQNEQITQNMLPDSMRPGIGLQELSAGGTYREIVDQLEANLFESYLAKGYSTRRIAEELGVSQPTVVRKINRLKAGARRR